MNGMYNLNQVKRLNCQLHYLRCFLAKMGIVLFITLQYPKCLLYFFTDFFTRVQKKKNASKFRKKQFRKCFFFVRFYKCRLITFIFREFKNFMQQYSFPSTSQSD